MDKIRKVFWNASRRPPGPLYAAVGWTLACFGWVLVAVAYFWISPLDFWLRLAAALFFISLAIGSLAAAEWHNRLLRVYFRQRPYRPSAHSSHSHDVSTS